MKSTEEHAMSGLPILRGCLAVGLLTTVSCTQLPPDVSQDYHYVPVVSPYPSYGPPTRTHYALLPDACLVPDPTDPMFVGPHIPPGCANAHNLEFMVERKQDLLKGRALGAAPGVTSARAAEKYLYGEQKPPLGAGIGRSGSTQSPPLEVAPGPSPSAPVQVHGTGG
jgi:hypothetical protein